MKIKHVLLLLIVFAVTGCLPEVPEIPTKAYCTADGWRFDPVTLEIITDDSTGAAMECDFK